MRLPDVTVQPDVKQRDWHREILSEATDLCRAGLGVHPDQPSLLRLRGLLAARNGQREFAWACLSRAACLDSTDRTTLAEIDALSVRDGLRGPSNETAMREIERSCCPRDATDQLCVFAEDMEARDRFRDAAEAYRRALRGKHDNLRALIGLGRVSISLADFGEAARCFEGVLAVAPRHALAHVRLGWALHGLGSFRRASAQFEWYEHLMGSRDFEQPRWDGGPIGERTILLWADLALGDTVQCLRYVSHVKNRATRVVVECQRTLLPLVERMPGVDGVVGQGAPLPSFDVHAPLMSLPRLFRTDRDSIPHDVPYLSVDTRLAKAWHEKLGRTGSRTVGIVWAAADGRPQSRVKSIPLRAFAPLADVKGIRFISLQFGEREEEFVAPPPGLRIERVLSHSSTVADTAAVMLNLDLIISVDTFAAHLAGALARPVWLLAPRGAAWWLWHNDGDVSLWYPTMRVFRQTREGDWLSVIERVRALL